jgi:regulator of replication initiation timing
MPLDVRADRLMREENDRLQAENERLREALKVVLSFGSTLPADCREIVLEVLRNA